MGGVAALWLFAGMAVASPWAEAGDARLRSDIMVLAAAGVIDDITMQWPLPWGGILDRLEEPGALGEQPDYVRDAAMRVRARGMAETETHKPRASLTLDAASGPSTVRGFDAMGRQTVQGRVLLEYLWDTTAVHLAAGAQTTNRIDHQAMVPDGSYIAQRLGNATVYAGYKTHWWGPGWVSAMSLSNNARPVLQIGIARAETAPFESPWLSWIGPWQAEFFIGLLDGPRAAKNTVYTGARFAFSPLPHLEIGFSRTTEMCGSGHECKPLAGYFGLLNDDKHVNLTNDEATIDLRYSGAFAGWAYEIYTQAMNEDTSPFVHSGTSHLFGSSVWVPIEDGVGRLTFEYADSLATKNIWGGGIMHGTAYNNYDYVDGMRYRGRTLGFSLDSDSQLVSVQANFTDQSSRSFTLAYHHTNISDPLNAWGNVVTAAPVTINLAEGRFSQPLRLFERSILFDIAARLQDDQPRPDKGFQASVEVALTVSL